VGSSCKGGFGNTRLATPALGLSRICAENQPSVAAKSTLCARASSTRSHGR
jgi:hypothetical protein